MIRKFDATCVVKTWANAWATSHRMHEEIVLPCLFGCSQTDSLRHYLHCPILFGLLRALHPDVSEMPLERIGLQYSSEVNLKRVSALSQHIMRAKELSEDLEVVCLIRRHSLLTCVSPCVLVF